MKILVRDLQGLNRSVDIDDNETVDSLKAIIEVELSIPYQMQMIKFQGRVVNNDNAKLSSIGIMNNSQIELVNTLQQQYQMNQNNNGNSNLRNVFQNTMQQLGQNVNQNTNPLVGLLDQQMRQQAIQMKQYYENNPDQLNYILHQKPEMAQAILNDDPTGLITILKKQKEEELRLQKEENDRKMKIMNDPMNPEHQKYIEQQIKQQQINEQYEYAQEYIPEAFGQVTMLYINIQINKKQVQAFVDSGAQSTIMSYGMAMDLGLDRLIDTRFKGKALGVGVGNILGRIHAVDMTIEGKHVQCSLTILEDDKVDFLFGLDNLKRHRCSIDLKNDKLIFHDIEIQTPFLSEGQIKKTVQQKFEDNTEMTNDDKLAQLMGLGASEQQSNELLKKANNDLQLASQMFLQLNSQMF